MPRSSRRTLLLAALVPVSSLLGLTRPMAQLDGWSTFAAVWKANLWGDLAFTAGTLAAGWATLRAAERLRRQGRPAWQSLGAAAALSFLLHWVVYAFSWSFTGNASDTAAHSGQSFFAWTFGRFGDAWGFTFQWGWLGLLACAVLVPLVAWLGWRAEDDAGADGDAPTLA